jgi:hypothetical protein
MERMEIRSPNLAYIRGFYVTEATYQRKLIEKLEAMFPGCVIVKNDPQYRQGFLDLTLLYGRKWASLEVKASASSKHQPNQEHFVQVLDNMSFAAFIYPENEEEVLSALQQAFRPPRRTRISQS